MDVFGYHSCSQFRWDIRALPWLILMDSDRIVRAEGFAVTELDQKVRIITNE